MPREREEGGKERKRTLQTRARVLVPEVDGAVGAAGGERAMYGVEGDVVHGVDEGLLLGLVAAVALEGEVIAASPVSTLGTLCIRHDLPRIFVFNIS